MYITKFIIFELKHILDKFIIFKEFQMDKIQNLESIYTIWYYLIKGVPNTISEKKQNHRNSIIRNSMEQMTYDRMKI